MEVGFLILFVIYLLGFSARIFLCRLDPILSLIMVHLNTLIIIKSFQDDRNFNGENHDHTHIRSVFNYCQTLLYWYDSYNVQLLIRFIRAREERGIVTCNTFPRAVIIIRHQVHEVQSAVMEQNHKSGDEWFLTCWYERVIVSLQSC